MTVNRFETLEQPVHEHPCVLAVPKFQYVQGHGHFEDRLLARSDKARFCGAKKSCPALVKNLEEPQTPCTQCQYTAFLIKYV